MKLMELINLSQETDRIQYDYLKGTLNGIIFVS